MLKPDSSQQGLWVNDAWTLGSPGTFAVIIGVSRYRNLNGSPACFGLGQLLGIGTHRGRRFLVVEIRILAHRESACEVLVLVVAHTGRDIYLSRPERSHCGTDFCQL